MAAEERRYTTGEACIVGTTAVPPLASHPPFDMPLCTPRAKQRSKQQSKRLAKQSSPGLASWHMLMLCAQTHHLPHCSSCPIAHTTPLSPSLQFRLAEEHVQFRHSQVFFVRADGPCHTRGGHGGTGGDPEEGRGGGE